VSRVRLVGLLALAIGLFATAALHAPRVPPIFDGIIVPPEPYRWVSPPPNLAAGNQPPLSGEATIPVNNGQVAGGGVQTADNQVIMFFGAGYFKAGTNARSARCSIDPDRNPPVMPSGIDLRGNVYRVNCIAQPDNGPVTAVSPYHLTLRFPPGAFKEIQYYDGTHWRALNTLRAPGGDPYASVNAPGFGEFAATAPTGAAPAGDSIISILGRYVEFYGILAFVVIFGAIAVVQELRRRRHRQPGLKRTPPRPRGKGKR
jgi:hypothetical protein